MEKERIKIEIWSDVVCPFCILGKKKIEQAIKKLGAADKTEIIWHSFQLDPAFPKSHSTPYYEYLSKRIGYSIDQLKVMGEQLVSQGKNYEIDYQFDNILVINSFDAHRLIHWAKSFGLSHELNEAFMVAYLTEGTDLSKEGNLYSVVEKVGLAPEAAKKVLQSDECSDEVNQDIQQANAMGIRGVPFFLINGAQGISGAQEDAIFETVISNTLQKAGLVAANFKEGATCLPNKACKLD